MIINKPNHSLTALHNSRLTTIVCVVSPHTPWHHPSLYICSLYLDILTHIKINITKHYYYYCHTNRVYNLLIREITKRYNYYYMPQLVHILGGLWSSQATHLGGFSAELQHLGHASHPPKRMHMQQGVSCRQDATLHAA